MRAGNLVFFMGPSAGPDIRLLWVLQFIAVFMVLISSRAASGGDVYEYTNKDGSKGYSDGLQGVPEEHRRGFKGKEPQAKERLPLPADAGQARGIDLPAEDRNDDKERPVSVYLNWLDDKRLPGALLMVVLCAAIIAMAGRIGNTLGRKEMAVIIRIIITVGLLLFLFNTYARGIVDMFMEMRQETLEIKERAEQRNENLEKKARELLDEPKKE